MIKSMTGYGRAQRQIDGRDITVEMKSVNHRFFEFSARVPRMYGYIEEKLKSYVQGQISRGKIEMSVTIQSFDAGNVSVAINKELAGAYIAALRELGHEYHLQDDLTLSSVSRFSDIFTVSKEPDDEEAIWIAVKSVADQAVEKFVAMRTGQWQ